MSTRKLEIGSLVAVVILVAVGVGFYFTVGPPRGNLNGGESKSNESHVELTTIQTETTIKTDPPLPMFLASTIDGRILQLDTNLGNYTTLVKEETYPIRSFEFYREKYILFYATTELYVPIKTLGHGRKPSMDYSASWTKTAMAIDYVTERLFVLDGSAWKIYAIDTKNDSYSVYLEKLDRPKDILVDAEKRLMFIMLEMRVLRVEIDTGKIPLGFSLVTHNVAFAIDRKRGEIYLAESEHLSSENYERNRSILYGKFYILSMTVFENHLFYINMPANATKISLIKCSVSVSECSRRIGEIAVLIDDEQVSLLSNIRAYD